MSRPSQSVTGWASGGVIATSIPPAEVALGQQPADPVPAAWINLFGAWIGYIEGFTPSDGVWNFREWECPDDSAYDLRWSDASSPTSDGILQGALKGATIALDSGFRFAVSGSGSLGFSAGNGVYEYDFAYDTSTDTFTKGSPPDLLDIYAPAACGISSDTTTNRDPTGAVTITGSIAGSPTATSFFLGYHGGAKGDESGAGLTECFLREASIVLEQLTASSGSPDTDVSIQSMAANGLWATHATENLTTPITGGGAPTVVPITVTASSLRQIPRGRPLRLLVEQNAIPGETQSMEIVSISLTYIRTAVD